MKAIKTGIVGIGRAGWKMHCKELEGREGKFTVAAACDTIKERREKMNEKYGCAVYEDIHGIASDPEVELLSIATPSPYHVEHARIALEAGKLVFLEKPVAVNRPQVEELELLTAKYDGNIFFRHNRRFEPTFQHIKEIFEEGILGDVYEIKLRRNKYQRRADWQTIIDCGGGQLNNWGPHIIDHALRFINSPVVSVWSDLKRIAALGDAEDHLKIVLKGENGICVDLEISGGAAISEPEYLILGTRGALKANRGNIELKYLNPEQKLQDMVADPGTPPMEGSFGNKEELDWIEKTIEVAPKAGCKMDDIWDHLYDTIRNSVPFPIRSEEALEVAKLTCEIKENTPFV